MGAEALWVLYGLGVAAVIYGILGGHGWRTILRAVAAVGASALLLMLLLRVASSIGLL